MHQNDFSLKNLKALPNEEKYIYLFITLSNTNNQMLLHIYAYTLNVNFGDKDQIW